MRITTLVENSSVSKYFENEHGLSLYIESGNHKILFDAGFTNMYIKNAEKLDIDIKEVDMVVISHGHYDHIGGLIHFLEINKKAKVYLKSEVFDFNFYSIRGNERKYVGPSVELNKYKDRFVLLKEAFKVDNLHFITDVNTVFPGPKANVLLHKIRNNKLYKDDFEHELIFVIEHKEGLIVLCGCAHNGILNTLDSVSEYIPNTNIHSVIGGFHLLDKSERTSIETDNELNKIGKELLKFNINGKYYTGHCTGKNAYRVLSNIMNDKLTSISTGSSIKI